MESAEIINEFQHSTNEIIKILQYRDRHEAQKYDISPTQNYTLHEISEHDGLTMSELSDRMMLAISTMTRIVDQLVKRKLVKRVRDKKDKRICTLKLTPQGKSLLTTINKSMFETQKEILEKVDPRFQGMLLNAVKAFEKATKDWKNHESHLDPDLLH